MYMSDRLSPSPALGRLPLLQMVTDIDRSFEHLTRSLLLRVTDNPPKLAVLEIGDAHPANELLGFTAPTSWRAVGVRCHGQARWFDSDDDARNASATASDPEPVVYTALIDRAGRGAGVMRRGATAMRFDEPPEGTLGDCCRRALGLPTAPPPDSTVELWLRIWLERVVEAAVLPAAHPPGSWPEVAALHPAAPVKGRPMQIDLGSPVDPGSLLEPHTLADATHCLAAAWPWTQLRHDPEVVDTGSAPITPDVAAWMDDGLFARWVLGETADLATSLRTVELLLPAEVVQRVVETLDATGQDWLES